LHTWLDDVSKLTTDDPVKLVLGNKCDMLKKEVQDNDKNVLINNKEL
jgi:ribosome biogenesis GTPase A